MKQIEKQKDRFSLRKLSVGLSSVFLGAFFLTTTSAQVQADTVKSGAESNLQNADEAVQTKASANSEDRSAQVVESFDANGQKIVNNEQNNTASSAIAKQNADPSTANGQKQAQASAKPALNNISNAADATDAANKVNKTSQAAIDLKADNQLANSSASAENSHDTIASSLAIKPNNANNIASNQYLDSKIDASNQKAATNSAQDTDAIKISNVKADVADNNGGRVYHYSTDVSIDDISKIDNNKQIYFTFNPMKDNQYISDYWTHSKQKLNVIGDTANKDKVEQAVKLSAFDGGYALSFTDQISKLSNLQLHLDLYWGERASAQNKPYFLNNGSLYTQANVNNYQTDYRALDDDINIGIGDKEIDDANHKIGNYQSLYKGNSNVKRTITLIPENPTVTKATNDVYELVWSHSVRTWYDDDGTPKVDMFPTFFSIGPSIGDHFGQYGKLIMKLPYNTDLFAYRKANGQNDPVENEAYDMNDHAKTIQEMASQLRDSLAQFAYVSNNVSVRLADSFVNDGSNYSANVDYTGGHLLDKSHITVTGKDLGSKDGMLYFELDYNVDQPVIWASFNSYKGAASNDFSKQAPFLAIYDKTKEATVLPNGVTSFDNDKQQSSGYYDGPKLANADVQNWLETHPYESLILGSKYGTDDYQAHGASDGKYKLVTGSGKLLTDFLNTHNNQGLSWGPPIYNKWVVDPPNKSSNPVPASAVTVKEAKTITTHKVIINYVDANANVKPHTNILVNNAVPTSMLLKSFTLTNDQAAEFAKYPGVNVDGKITNQAALNYAIGLYNDQGIPDNWESAVFANGLSAYDNYNSSNANSYTDQFGNTIINNTVTTRIFVPIVHKQVKVIVPDENNTINAEYVVNNNLPAKYNTPLNKPIKFTVTAKRDEWQDLVDDSRSFGQWKLTGGISADLIEKDGKITEAANTDENLPKVSVAKFIPMEDVGVYNYIGVYDTKVDPGKITGLIMPFAQSIASLDHETTSVIFSVDWNTVKGLNSNDLRTVLPGGVANINYIPASFDRHVIFYDDTDHKLIADHKFTSPVDTVKRDLGLNVPDHYSLAENNQIPDELSFETSIDKNNLLHLDLSPVTVHLVHKYDDVTDSSQLNKTITRTVIIKEPDKEATVTKQLVKFSRTGKTDEVSGKTVFSAWEANGTDTWPSITVPTVEGYNPSSTVDSKKVTPDMGDFTLTVTYQPLDRNFSVNYVSNIDKHTIIKAVSQKGKTDQTITIDYGTLPDGWEIVPGQDKPQTRKIDAQINPDINIMIQHAFIKDAEPDTRIVTRTVILKDSNGTQTQLAQQSFDFTRVSYTDAVDHITKKYDPWNDNGLHVFDEVDAPAKAGYGINGSAPRITIDPNYGRQTVVLNYVANAQQSYWQFKDISPKQGAAPIDQHHNIAGQTDQTIPLNIISQIPLNYELADGVKVPDDYTFKPSNNQPIIINLKHKTQDISNDPDHYDVKRIISRTIHVIKPAAKETKQEESVVFTRSGVKDLVTGDVTYGRWNEDQQILPGLNVDNVPGYTPSQTVDDLTVTPDSKNSEIYVTYSANPQSVQLQYLDRDENNKLVASQLIDGRTDETKLVTISAPDKYKLAPNQLLPNSYTFKADKNDPIKIYLIHDTEEVTHDHPKNENGLREKDLNQTVGRIINVYQDSQKLDTINQTENIYRNAVKDLVNGKITYTDWTIPVKTQPAYKYSVKDGYSETPDGVKELAIKPDMGVINETINVSADTQNSQIIYVDKDNNNTPVKVVIITGTTDQTLPINIPDQVPPHFKLVDSNNVPKQYVFKAKDNQPISVLVEHEVEKVDHDHPKDEQGLTKDDLNQAVGRIINVYQDSQKLDTINQTENIYRDAVKDLVNGKITYTDWTIPVKTQPAYKYNVKDGYSETPDGVKELAIKPGMGVINETINVSANTQNSQIIYVDKDNNNAPVKVVKITGTTDQTLPINIPDQVPPHFKLVDSNNVPKQYVFKAKDNQPISVLVEHEVEKVDHDHPKDEQGLTKDDLNQTVGRIITLNKPDGKQDVDQTESIYRDAVKDLVTGKITYTDWTIPVKHFDKYVPENVSGYKADPASVDAVTISADMGVKHILINYEKGFGQQTIHYVDVQHNPVTTQIIIGKIGQDVKFTPDIPRGWVIKSKIPNTLPINSIDKPITYVIDHGHKLVLPTDPHKKGEIIPGTDGIQYPAGVDKGDLTKVITRTINISKPNGTEQTVVQSVNVGRSGDIDLVTGQVTYSKWDYLDKNETSFDQFNIPQFTGYDSLANGKLAKIIAQEVADPNGNNQVINVTYAKVAKKSIPNNTDYTPTPETPEVLKLNDLMLNPLTENSNQFADLTETSSRVKITEKANVAYNFKQSKLSGNNRFANNNYNANDAYQNKANDYVAIAQNKFNVNDHADNSSDNNTSNEHQLPQTGHNDNIALVAVGLILISLSVPLARRRKN